MFHVRLEAMASVPLPCDAASLISTGARRRGVRAAGRLAPGDRSVASLSDKTIVNRGRRQRRYERTASQNVAPCVRARSAAVPIKPDFEQLTDRQIAEPIPNVIVGDDSSEKRRPAYRLHVEPIQERVANFNMRGEVAALVRSFRRNAWPTAKNERANCAAKSGVELA